MRQQISLDWRSLPPEAKQQFLEELQKRQGSRVSLQFKRKYRNDRVAFVHDCFNWRVGEKPAGYQDDILAAAEKHKRRAVRGPHGLGKTAIAAWEVIHFAITRDGDDLDDWKVPTTASAWRQLTKFLWPEIAKWTRRLKWDLLGRPMFDKRTELLALSLKLSTGEAFAMTSDEHEMIEGSHAPSLLLIFDEAKAIKPETFDACEGALSGGDSTEAYALAISTPGECSGRFYEIHKRAPGYEDWWVRHVTLEECIAAGRVSREWAEQRAKQWGPKSAVFQNRVKGEFCSSDADGVIPLSWIELANERWLEWNENKTWGTFDGVGVDVSRSQNGDKTCLALRHEKVITEIRRTTEVDVMSVTGQVAGILKKRGGRAVVDVIGVGAGVYDRLAEQKFKAVPFNASESTTAKDRSGELEFLNKRAAAWWNMRELLDPANGEDVALPPDDELIGDLASPHWKVTSSGKVQIESKDDLRKRLGRSTDTADAVVMIFFEQPKRRILFA
ncbi:MAG TPA: hypothetical protein VMZ30_02105 [Pyrinomonadaceae bacterium]|nr:hypothetical protein [Pyrinomonadaceae bacterium]